jgi:hypothetical protein
LARGRAKEAATIAVESRHSAGQFVRLGRALVRLGRVRGLGGCQDLAMKRLRRRLHRHPRLVFEAAVVVGLLAIAAIGVAAYALGRSSTTVNVDWGSLVLAVVAVGGLVLAGYQARLNSQERLTSHRQVLYEQQILAFNDIMSALAKVQQILNLAVFASFPFQPTPWIWTRESMEAARQAQFGSSNALWLVREARDAILPAVVAEGLSQWEADVRDLFVVDGRCAQARLDKTIRTRARVTEAMRLYLGVEPLSRQTLERIGIDEIAKSLEEWHARHRPAEGGTDPQGQLTHSGKSQQ